MARKLLILTFGAALSLFVPRCFADGEADLAAAKALLDSREYSRAQTAYSDIIKAYPGSDYDLQAKGRLAQFYISRQNRDAAEQLLRDIL